MSVTLDGDPLQVKYAEDLMKEIYGEDSENAKGGSLLTCIAVTSLVGRLVCGKLADHPQVNRIFLQQGRMFNEALLGKMD